MSEVVDDFTLAVIMALPDHRARKVPGLRRQAIRAASSISPNLSEGCSRSEPEFLHFVEIAIGSLNEVERHLTLARKAGVCPQEVHAALQSRIEIIRRMLVALSRTLLRSIAEKQNTPPNN